MSILMRDPGMEIAKLKAENERLLKALGRAVYIAEHLHAMVPRDVWRDQGGDDMQGHYEGDYHAEQVAEEIKILGHEARDRSSEAEPPEGAKA